MEFRDLKAQYVALKADIDKGIQSVIEGGHYILGPQVEELEKNLAEFVGVKHCVSCANGTDALLLILMAHEIGAGDAVFTPVFTFMATASVASVRGATPVFVDIDKDTFNICPKALERAIEKTIADGKLKPKAIIPVDLFGQPANYPEIEAIASKYNLLVIEDGAQGFGGAINGKRACSFGHISATSFFPAKPLGCYGDGGAIFTNDDAMDSALRSIRAQGRSPVDKYDNISIGLNSRLDTLQAAILLPKLKAFEEYELAATNNIANLYTEKLQKVVKTPYVPTDYYSSWAQYTILTESATQRADLQKKLKAHGVPSMIYYPKPLHMQAAFAGLGYADNNFPVAQEAAGRVLSLPMHPYLSEDDVEAVSKAVIEGL